MTASHCISQISGILEAVHAHLNFKLRNQRRTLSSKSNNSLNNQLITIEIYRNLFQKYKEKSLLHKAGRVMYSL